MKDTQIWPDLLYIVRHGESAGNVARDGSLDKGAWRELRALDEAANAVVIGAARDDN